jgi:hypothetical protein
MERASNGSTKVLVKLVSFWWRPRPLDRLLDRPCLPAPHFAQTCMTVQDTCQARQSGRQLTDKDSARCHATHSSTRQRAMAGHTGV